MKYLAITAVLCLVLAGASFAGNVTMTEVITGGNLTLTMPGNFSLSTGTLGGVSAREAGEQIAYYVEDSRGTGAGWNLGFQISQFVTSGTPQRYLPNQSYMNAGSPENRTCIYGQAIDNTYGPEQVIDGNRAIGSSEVKVLFANAGYGMGKYEFEMYHWIMIPASTYAGTYTATVTATLNNAP